MPHVQSRSRSLTRRRRWAAVFASLLLPFAHGCTRKHYRLQADGDTYSAVAQATINPRFAVPDFTINVDPRSRFFDPTDPDNPPMPPDDPESTRLMDCVYGMKGARGWHRFGDLPDVELSNWRDYLPVAENGEVEIDLQKVMELARLHSRDYQSQLETLYLSALDVTFERFRFDTQFFGGNLSTLTLDGPVRGGGESSSVLGTTSSLRAQKLYATGGELIAGIANSIVYQFAGPSVGTRTSLLNFAFTQPLARLGGRAVTLERLTFAERSLLANVRQFERYRNGFYIQLATGADSGGGLSRVGGFFGGAGLEGFSGLGGGGFGRVGSFGAAGPNAFAGGGGIGGTQAGGFYGLLQLQQNIRNQQSTVVALRDTWNQLEAAYEAGRIDRFQADFARQNYYSAQSQLINVKAAYESTLDFFKMQVGLPPNVPFRVQDSRLDQFNFIDPQATAVQNELADLLDELRESEPPIDEATHDLWLERLTGIHALASVHLQQVRDDSQRLDELRPVRREALIRLQNLPEVVAGDVDRRAIDPGQPDRAVVRVTDDLQRLEEDFTVLNLRLDELRQAAAGGADEDSRGDLIQYATDLSGTLLELSLIQARARLHAIDLVHVEMDPEYAFQVALCNRPDWMNAKASLIDRWRLMRFNANALLSGLNLTVSGDLGTVRNNPFDFNGANSRLFFGLEFDAPLTRTAERNLYRQSLIEYQQQRRSLMAFRDEILRGLRSRVRQIQLDQLNLELRREAVELAINQVDLARLKLNQPPKPAVAGAAPEVASPTTARDAVDALNRLLEFQVSFLGVWLEFEIQRLLLDFDMGTMRIDDRGMWVDPGPISSNTLPHVDVPSGEEGIPPEIVIPDLPEPTPAMDDAS